MIPEAQHAASSIDYVGEFAHQLDARNRVTVPSTWRVEGDDARFYFAWPHPEGCIAVFPPQLQRELLEKARAVRQSDKRGQALLRNLFGKGFTFGCDKQGRILLPESLVAHAGIEKKVWLVGLGRSFEVWSDARYPQGSDVNVLAAMEALGI